MTANDSKDGRHRYHEHPLDNRTAAPLVRAVSRELGGPWQMKIRYSLSSGVTVFTQKAGSWRVNHEDFKTLMNVLEDALVTPTDLGVIDIPELESYLERYFPPKPPDPEGLDDDD